MNVYKFWYKDYDDHCEYFVVSETLEDAVSVLIAELFKGSSADLYNGYEVIDENIDPKLRVNYADEYGSWRETYYIDISEFEINKAY